MLRQTGRLKKVRTSTASICFSETGFFQFQTTSKAAYIRPTATKPGLCGIIMNILIVKSIKNGHKAFIPPTIRPYIQTGMTRADLPAKRNGGNLNILFSCVRPNFKLYTGNRHVSLQPLRSRDPRHNQQR
ncbi:hypothetical protein NEIMUCOT_05676 [Neisseria mucosa ATCC 25996]|uniref:Uncharacterized protein n=1 Tax=Neisseria mucosa (strain ATCC 25996 / DSM 4631 / NCTC 10774 / M26) TaxID=546266 RepID=D2ZYG7_NEIM2|nr:hypothetical protein NEIMUCOT_05676 [Neisseria mucosa ATCC 25996]SUA38171.1 Uncharacterised protein [Neisseria mucosa]